MKLQVAKWGYSLAVRLSAECARAAGLGEGDSVEAKVTPAGTSTLTPAKPFDKAVFLTRIRKRRAAIPPTEATVERMRRQARY
jgi:antitoxin MazE